MSSFNNNNTTPNFDNLLLQSLMTRLQLRPSPPPSNHPLLSQSFEDLLLDAATHHPFSLSDDSDSDDFFSGNDDHKSNLAKEESRLEKELIKRILSGNTDSLKPNSGQAVAIGEHHICVGFHEEEDSEYRVWEWHGHIMLFDEEEGYSPEYIYGNYLERVLTTGDRKAVVKKEKKSGRGVGDEDGEEDEEKVENLGLRELIEDAGKEGSRVLHRGRNAGSTRI